MLLLQQRQQAIKVLRTGGKPCGQLRVDAWGSAAAAAGGCCGRLAQRQAQHRQGLAQPAAHRAAHMNTQNLKKYCCVNGFVLVAAGWRLASWPPLPCSGTTQ